MPEEKSKPAVVRLLVFFLLLFSFFFPALSMRNTSVTYDEPQHYRYGLQLLRDQNAERFDDSKMPLSMVNALPRATALGLQKILDLDDPPVFLYRMKTGRFATILVFSLLCFYVYRWSSLMYGWKGGILSLFLCTMSPNLIAHARLITTDIFAAATITVSLYYYWKMYREPGLKSVLKSSFALGLAMIAKYSSVFLVPILLLIGGIRAVSSALAGAGKESGGNMIHRITVIGGIVLLHILGIFLVINAGFLGNQSGKPLDEYQFQSDFFRGVQSKAGAAAKLPLPLPSPYLQGLDLVKYTDGHLVNNAVLLGEVKSSPQKFSNYYLITFIYKVPIAAQILICWSLLLIMRNWRSGRFLDNELFLLVPIGFLAVYCNFFLTTQIGIRFILPILPLLCILCGRIMSDGTRQRLLLVAILCGYQAISVFSWFPHYIPYFNELITDRKMAYQIRADSNIDFGQNEWYLAEFKKEHPEALFQPKYPVAGKLVVGVNFLDRVFPATNYGWLRDNFSPVGHIGYSHLIFDLSSDDLKKIDPSRIDYYDNPDSPVNTTGNSYYILNSWQGKSLERIGEPEEAALHYEKAAEFAPDTPSPHLALARMYRQQGELTKADEQEREAALLQRLSIIYQGGVAKIEEMRYIKALADLDAVISVRPAYRLALFYKGLALQLMNRQEESIPFYNQSLRFTPGYYQAFFNLAYALMKTGDYSGAIAYFEKTLAVRPDYEEARQLIQWCRKEMNSLQQ